MKKRLLPVLKVLVSAGLIFLLYRRVDLGDLWTVIRQVRPTVLALLFGLLLVNTVLSSLKWQILLRADGTAAPLPSLVASYLVGTFFNLFLPSSIGGDAYRVYDIARLSDRPAHAFASVFADRFSGFLAMVTLGAVAAVAMFARLPEQRILLVALAAFAGLLAIAALLAQERLLVSLMRRFRVDRIPRVHAFVEKFMASIRVYRTQPSLLWRVMAISFCFQALVIVCVHLIGRALGVTVPLPFYFAFVPLIGLVEALPVSIYGLGVRDASYVVFFTSVGATEAEALSMALFYVVVTVVYAASGGLVFVLRRPTKTLS